MSKFAKNFKKKAIDDVTEDLAKSAARTEIEIFPELQAFIPKLKEEESIQLEANILAEGVRDPLVIWEHEDKNILIDGHNRFSIIKKHGIRQYKIEKRQFADIEAVKDWMINLQLGRRNLTKEQMSNLRGLQYNREKKKAEDTLKKGNSPRTQNGNAGRTAEKLAKQHKVSKNTIMRDAEFAEGLEKVAKTNPELKQEILSGEVKVKKNDLQKLAKMKDPVKIEKPEDIAKAVAKPKPEVKKEPVQVSIKPECEGQLDIEGEVEFIEPRMAKLKQLRSVLDKIEKYWKDGYTPNIETVFEYDDVMNDFESLLKKWK